MRHCRGSTAGRKSSARSTADPNSLSAALGFDGRSGEGRGEVGDSGALRVKPTSPSHACGVGPSLSLLKGGEGKTDAEQAEWKMPDIKILARDLGFPEGPAWMSDGSVLRGEISGKKGTRVAPDGSTTEIGKAGGGPTGVATGPDGALYVCNNGGAVYETTPSFLSTGPAPDYRGGSIQRIDLKTGETRTLYTECNGHKLSAPNDHVFDKQGGFYFTDLGKRYKHHRDNGGLYYALPDGSSITELVYPIVTPNGVGLSPDEKTVYVADTETSRIYAWDIVSPGMVKHEPFPAPYGGRCVCGLPGFQRFDSLALEASGNICVATLVTGYITVISPSGQVVRQVKMPDVYPTNICFGGPDLKTAYITLSASGQLAAMDWPERGLRLNFMA